MKKPSVKVLHLIDSGGLYGAENVVLNLSWGLEKLNCQSVVGCFAYKGKTHPEVGMKAESLGLENVFFELQNKVDLTCALKVAAYCKRANVSIVHSHGYKPSLICMLMSAFYRIPYIITCHLWYTDNARLKLYTFLEKISMFFAKKVIGVSDEIVADLAKAGVQPTKLTVIDNGIDTEVLQTSRQYDELALRQELGLLKDTFVIGSLGRLTQQKDYPTLLQAAAELLKERRDVEFIVAGEGELQSELVALSHTLGIQNKFHFVGFRNDKEDLLKLIEVFVLTSLDEGLPIALLEAMAVKIPVVVTKVGGIPKVVKHGENGMLIEKGDFFQLKEDLVALMDDRHLREDLGTKGHEIVVQKFSIAQMTKKYLGVYQQTLGKT